ncbi:hypothetical protein [Mucilaginibacter sp. AK015]|uniref:hypothetical protein n=1 Tax=Mucilaginibacter sp. AK015 TaxID=2723072 RepID=UPI00161E2B93|nr:hypothetical protein [Mucilaginibacter sp. AK015]MBB5397247.1 hypothetical protein [Mucilaginibacter sp. AK015]
MRLFKIVAAWFLIAIGVLLFVLLLELNDVEIEGESGRVDLGAYFLSLIPIAIGAVILLIEKSNKKSG